jgi:hypothetical protein
MPPAVDDVAAGIVIQDGVTYWRVGIEGSRETELTPLARAVAVRRCAELGRERRVRAWIESEDPDPERSWELVYDPDAIE